MRRLWTFTPSLSPALFLQALPAYHGHPFQALSVPFSPIALWLFYDFFHVPDYCSPGFPVPSDPQPSFPLPPLTARQSEGEGTWVELGRAFHLLKSRLGPHTPSNQISPCPRFSLISVFSHLAFHDPLGPSNTFVVVFWRFYGFLEVCSGGGPRAWFWGVFFYFFEGVRRSFVLLGLVRPAEASGGRRWPLVGRWKRQTPP